MLNGDFMLYFDCRAKYSRKSLNNNYTRRISSIPGGSRDGRLVAT
jgi:hypothetical protein